MSVISLERTAERVALVRIDRPDARTSAGPTFEVAEARFCGRR